MDECNKGIVGARVCVVISNNSSAKALDRARKNNVPAFHISDVTASTEGVDNAILRVLEETETDIIILAGYLKKIGEPILKKYSGLIYNIHPSLLPKFGGKGMYGINVHKAVLLAKEPVTGVTIHKVNEKYDEGEIIGQTTVEVLENDTPEILAERVLQAEHVFLKEILYKIVKDYNEQFQ